MQQFHRYTQAPQPQKEAWHRMAVWQGFLARSVEEKGEGKDERGKERGKTLTYNPWEGKVQHSYVTEYVNNVIDMPV